MPARPVKEKRRARNPAPKAQRRTNSRAKQKRANRRAPKPRKPRRLRLLDRQPGRVAPAASGNRGGFFVSATARSWHATMNPAAAIVGVDTGGTFTDLIAFVGGALRVHKVLSTPEDPAAAV